MAKQNNFLTGYFAVLGIGALGLGYLAWSASSAADTAKANYEKTAATLTRLQTQKIFPKPENVDKKKAQVDAFAEKNALLFTQLQEYQQPLNEDLSNAQFQAKVLSTRDQLVAEAKDRGVTLPADFAAGMGDYLSNYPSAATVPKLDAWLEGINAMVRILVQSGVESLDALSRPTLAFEKPEAAPTPVDPKKKPPAKSTPKKTDAPKTEGPVVALPESAVIERLPFSVTFTGSNRSVNNVLSTLANTKGIFFNIRSLRIENEKVEGPDKDTKVDVKEEPVEGGDPIKRDALYILGNEKIKVHLAIDLLRFLEPADKTASAKK